MITVNARSKALLRLPHGREGAAQAFLGTEDVDFCVNASHFGDQMRRHSSKANSSNAATHRHHAQGPPFLRLPLGLPLRLDWGDFMTTNLGDRVTQK